MKAYSPYDSDVCIFKLLLMLLSLASGVARAFTLRGLTLNLLPFTIIDIKSVSHLQWRKNKNVLPTPKEGKIVTCCPGGCPIIITRSLLATPLAFALCWDSPVIYRWRLKLIKVSVDSYLLWEETETLLEISANSWSAYGCGCVQWRWFYKKYDLKALTLYDGKLK